jgi:A/G-specific adenine glycosylase
MELIPHGGQPYELARLLLDWYHDAARTLPWRGRQDPYAIWVSEIMLQQTRVETVIPYYEKWMALFPTVQSLAEAQEQDVLKAWEGLGYYSRARNMRRAAQKVVEQFGGEFPQDVAALRLLPGVGRYTAGAIASIAFGKDEPALDGNIRRVLARIFDVDLPARSPQGEARLWELAAGHLPIGQAGEYNQAIMDLGATICTPRAPACLICPVMQLCRARELGIQDLRPVLEKKAAVPHYLVTAAILQRDDRVLIARRPENGLLGGLWEFPGGKLEEGEDLPACLRREITEELGVAIRVGDEFGVYQHAYTHFRVTLHAFYCTLCEGEPRAIQPSDLVWVAVDELAGYPMGKIDRQISRDLVRRGIESAG